MRIVAISDTHNAHSLLKIPECDVLIHAGDFSNKGTYTEAASFLNWMGEQKNAKHKICIAGNHDFIAQKEPVIFNMIVPRNVTYLRDSEVIIDEVKFYGTPWTPFFYDWAFNGLESRDLEGMFYEGGPAGAAPDKEHPLLSAVYSSIPINTNVLICHTPPRLGTLDVIPSKDNYAVGSRELLKVVNKLPSLKVVIGGHIHEGYGRYKHRGTIDVYNAACMTRDHRMANPITIIDL